jgi:hypothetical protein
MKKSVFDKKEIKERDNNQGEQFDLIREVLKNMR